jgi:predicted MFS family arabinose efflux permease
MGFFDHLGLSEVYSFKRNIIWTFVILLLMSVILLADQNVMSPNIQAIEDEFRITDREIGLVGSAFTLVAAIITLLWGYLSDKFSRKWLLVGAVLVGEIPCFLTGFAQNYSQLLVLRILTGIGIGGMVPVTFSLLGDLFTDRQRSTAQAWYQAISAVGILLGMIVAGFLGPALGWRIPFIVVSAPNFIFILMLIFMGGEPKRGSGEQEIKDLLLSGKEYRVRLQIKDYINLVKIPSNIWLFLQGIPGTVAWGILPFYLITFYQRHKGYSVELATILLLVLGLGTIVGKLFGGIIGNKLYLKSRKLLPIFNGVTTLIGIIPILVTLSWPAPQNPDIVSIIPPALFGFLGASIIAIAGPNVQAMLMNVNPPEYRGAISSIFNLTDSIGAGFGPFIGGLLSTARNLDFAMKTSALFWIPCGLLFFILIKYLPRDTEKLRRQMLEVRREMEQPNARNPGL